MTVVLYSLLILLYTSGRKALTGYLRLNGGAVWVVMVRANRARAPVVRHSSRNRSASPSSRPPLLRLVTLNICDGRRNRLNAALRCMRQMNVDVGILTETKFTNTCFTKLAEGYRVVGTTTTGNIGGIALIYRETARWSIESTRTFGSHVVRYAIVSGQRRWYLIGVYIPPSEETGETLGHLSEAYDTLPSTRWPVIIAGDLNMDTRNPSGTSTVGLERRLETAALISTWGLVSLSDCFRSPSRRIGRRWTWSQEREGRMIHSRCDHILTDKGQHCVNCQLKIPRFESDHLAVLAVFRLGPVQSHRRYVKQRTHYPIKQAPPRERNAADILLSELQEAAAEPERDSHRSRSWITKATWQLIDRKASARRSGDLDVVRTLKGQVRRALQRDRKARAAAAAALAEQFLSEGDIHKAFGAIRGCVRRGRTTAL